MATTDRILVERVTDGEKCGEDCPFPMVDSEGWNCGLFGKQIDYDEHGFSRCPSCLATPSHECLTEEQREVLREAYKAIKRLSVTSDGVGGDIQLADAICAAFPGVGEEVSHG